MLSMDTRIVKKRVLPKKANATMRIGPSNQWKSTLRWMPVPSRPNHTQSIHFEIVIGSWVPSTDMLVSSEIMDAGQMLTAKPHH